MLHPWPVFLSLLLLRGFGSCVSGSKGRGPAGLGSGRIAGRASLRLCSQALLGVRAAHQLAHFARSSNVRRHPDRVSVVLGKAEGFSAFTVAGLNFSSHFCFLD